jgi:hypothetical protein
MRKLRLGQHFPNVPESTIYELTQEQCLDGSASSRARNPPTDHELVGAETLHLQPVAGNATSIKRSAALRDHSFKACFPDHLIKAFAEPVHVIAVTDRVTRPKQLLKN